MRRLPYLPNPIKLDLGCGKVKNAGFVGLDCNDYGQEIVWDANQGLPFPNDSVVEFRNSHFFEHIRWEELPNLLGEIVRVAKDGTRLPVVVTHENPDAFHFGRHMQWNEQVIRGIVADHCNLGLVSMSRQGPDLHVVLVVKKIVHRERVKLGQYDDGVEREHVARYKWAAQFCAGKTVADIACGTGYGMDILRTVASKVDGYDKEPLCGNRIIDLEKQAWTDRYDVIVSFETLEHLSPPDFFLTNLKNTAKLVVVSTPLNESPGNPHHKQFWSFAQAKALLEQHFTCEYFFQQDEEITTTPGSFLIAVAKPR